MSRISAPSWELSGQCLLGSVGKGGRAPLNAASPGKQGEGQGTAPVPGPGMAGPPLARLCLGLGVEGPCEEWRTRSEVTWSSPLNKVGRGEGL